jgi:signal transduction histidine kinase
MGYSGRVLPRVRREPFSLSRVLVLLIGTLVVPSITLALFGILVLMSEDVQVAPYVLLMVLLFGSVAVGTTLVARAAWQGTHLARLKTDFVSHVSHELRTPLTSIRLFIETLQLGRARTDAERQKCLDLLARETARLSEMIERLLEWSRLEAGHTRLAAQHVEVAALVDDVIGAYRAQQLDAAVAIESTVPADLPSVWADRGAALEVLLNLVNNAFKYGGAAPRVHIVARVAGRFVAIDVEDGGPGVRRGDRKRIFERFYRADDLLSRRTEGTGLGLAIAKRLAEGGGGGLTYAPRREGGSRFTLRLPLKPPRQARARAAEPAQGDLPGANAA